MSALRRVVLLLAVVLGSFVLLTTAGASARTAAVQTGLVEVVVTLPQPSLAEAIQRDRTLAAAATTRHRLNLRAPASVDYVRTLAAAQRTLQARIQRTIPSARVHWRYDVTLNGMAVVVPRSQLATLQRIRGATVWPSVRYHALLDRTPQLIGAPQVWGPTLATAGEGVKIGVIDDGLDQTQAFFNPAGFSYPAGFPKGNTAYTTPKVIVARAFAGDPTPPRPASPNELPAAITGTTPASAAASIALTTMSRDGSTSGSPSERLITSMPSFTACSMPAAISGELPSSPKSEVGIVSTL